MSDLKANALNKTIRTSDGDAIQYTEFYNAKSRPFIDKIDRVLAQHYGFTDEELDFIHYNTFANYQGDGSVGSGWIRPSFVTLARSRCTKPGSGFSGRSFMRSSA